MLSNQKIILDLKQLSFNWKRFHLKLKVDLIWIEVSRLPLDHLWANTVYKTHAPTCPAHTTTV